MTDARRLLSAMALGCAFGAPWVLCACSSYQGDARASLPVPVRQGFGVVSSMLEPNCGTLDCHGGPARNFRIYGKRGIRALGDTVTGAVNDTNESDIDATYQSIVSIDPEALSSVFEARGRDPQRWIVVSKARGLEKHTGGARLAEGSPADRCLVSWAGGTLDASACTADSFGPMPREGETW